MKTRLLCLSCCFALGATAQIIVIDGLHTNGSLSWKGDATNFSRYHVEWSPTVTGPWSASWNGLTNLTASNGTMTVAVPMFYRVVGQLAPPPGENCETAPTNGPGTYHGTTVGYANDYDAAPQGTPSPGRDRVQRVIVPPNRILTATLTPTNTPLLDVVLLVLSGSVDCSMAGSNVLAAADAVGAGFAETVNWTNNTSGDLEVLVVVDSFTAEPAGDYVLTLALTSSLPGDICDTAESIGTGTTTGLTTVDYAKDHNPGSGCATAAGPDRFFRLTLPAGQNLTANVIPVTAWDAVVNIVSAEADCPAPGDCFAGADSGGPGGAETVQYLNNTASPLEVFLIVSGYNPLDSGTFELILTLAP